jgi:pimeloyl-ACP methyl ester carboxylesterase
MHIGGREVVLGGLAEREVLYSPGNPAVMVDPNGAFEVEQMYVQYVRLAAPKARHPLLLMHGGGLCGVTYETKPDGQPGWQSWFLHAGHDVYVADAVERGRASWARFPEIFQGEPHFRTKAEAWELFRIGADGSWSGSASASSANPGTLFPIAAFDQFMKQTTPRWTTTDHATQAAYNTLVDDHGPFVIITHSQGANFAFRMAAAHPDKVAAIVAVEPSGFPGASQESLSALRHIPHLFVWGDHMSSSAIWRRIRQGLNQYGNGLRSQGVTVDELDLPAIGVGGNSHMLMMDTNSNLVASLIQKWLADKGLMLD